MKNIIYLLLLLFPVFGYSQIFVAEFDNIVSGTPSVGTYSAIGVFSDNDGYGQTTDSISTSGIHYFIDAGGQEYVIVAKSGSSPLTIEFNPINGAGSPELGIGQLTSKTNNQYHMTAAVGDLTRTKILNLNIQAGSTGSGVDSASYASDTLYLFLEGTTVAKTKVSPAITTFNLNGTNLELELANGGQSTVDLAAVAGITAPPILGQASEPTSDRFFWKDTDGDTTRVKAPYADQGYKDLAYYDDIMNITTNTYQGKAILDTIPLLAGIDQARLDSMHVIGITHNTVTINAATAARDTLYPDGFVISIYGGDSMIVAYSGIIEFPDSVFTKGKNYYQPYEYKKYQESPDSILEQLAFKALDTNIIEIRDRYSYLAENRLQSERSVPSFNITIEDFTSQTLKAAIVPDVNLVSWNPADSLITAYTDPIQSIPFSLGTSPRMNLSINGPVPYFESGSFYRNSATTFNDASMDSIMTVVVKFRIHTGTGSGTLVSAFTTDDERALQNQSFRLYHRDADGGLDEIEVWTDTNNDRYYVYNFNPLTGDRAYYSNGTGTPSTSLSTEGPYISESSLNRICIGCNRFNSGVWQGRIYGMYILSGNATAQEAQDMINNWDLYHKY